MPVVACVISSLILNVSLKFENAQLSLFSLIFQKVFFYYYYSLLEKHNNAATYSPHLDTAVLLHSGVQGDVQAGRMVECTREVLLYYQFQVLIIQHRDLLEISTRRSQCEPQNKVAPSLHYKEHNAVAVLSGIVF